MGAILFTHWGSVFIRHASTLSGCNDRPTQRILFVQTEEVTLRKEGREEETAARKKVAARMKGAAGS